MNYGEPGRDAAAVNRMPLRIRKRTASGRDNRRNILRLSGYSRYSDPDLMIRTSGELRLSNYLLWQMAYTEFYFTDGPMADFNKAELIRAIEKI